MSSPLTSSGTADEIPKSRVLIVDDGELSDVRLLLDELDVPFDQASGFDAPGIPVRVALLVTNGRLALASSGVAPAADTHLVVYDQVSRTVRKVLERSGCDLVLPRPVNPSAFRLLVAQAHYDGPERRRGRRAVMSVPIRIRIGRRTRQVTLTQLSLRGCGFTTDQSPRIGSEVQLSFPRELTETTELRCSGPVLAVRPSPTEEGLQHVAVAFRLLDAESRRIVNDVMQRHGGGARFRRRAAPSAPACPAPAGPIRPDADPAPPPEPDAPEASRERRSSPRKLFQGRVLAAGAGIAHVLIGRDLSTGGMRIRREPGLELGDELKLAVHSRPGLPAIMLRAVATRDDGDDGVVLRFHDVPPSIAARLQQIVDELPTLPTGQRSGSGARPGVVVSEVLGRS